MISMKCLSLKQPYADMIVEGIKTIELRKWNTKFRGTFLVHASKVPFESSYDKSRLGCVVGKVDLIAVKHYQSEENWKNDIQFHRADEDFIESKYGFILRNPVKFDRPIPISGQLQFFDLLYDESNNAVSRYEQQTITQEGRL